MISKKKLLDQVHDRATAQVDSIVRGLFRSRNPVLDSQPRTKVVSQSALSLPKLKVKSSAADDNVYQSLSRNSKLQR